MSIIAGKLCKLLTVTVITTLLSLFLWSNDRAMGEDITYPGSPLYNPYYAIGPNTVNMPNSLFPLVSVSGNTVTVQSDTVPGHVFGGIADTGTNATDNIVRIQGGTIGSTTTVGSGNVTGGWTFNGSTTGNSVEVTNATVRGIVYGGWVQAGQSGNIANSNTVTIGSGTIMRNNVYGGYTQGTGVVSENHVVINNGDMTAGSVDIVAGGYSALSVNLVSGNSVTINDGKITNAAIYGGRGIGASHITGNTVAINGGTISIKAGDAIYGGESINSTGIIDQNQVNITGGTVTATIYGGGTTNSGHGTVRQNTVTIGGTTMMTGDIYGGYSYGGTATSNTVTIGGTATFGAGSDLFGGYVSSGGGDAFTDNTLNKNNAATVGEVWNFEFVNFGYSDNAGIAILYTTATGSAESGVTLSVTGSNEINFGGVITGTGNLTKIETGTLALSNAGGNLFDGGLDIKAGTVAFNQANQITVGSGKAVTLKGDGATLRFDADMTLNSSSSNIVIDMANNTDTGFFNTNGNTVRIDGINGQNGNMAKTGNGTLILTDDTANIQNGNIQVRQGVLQLGDGGTTGSMITSSYNISAGVSLAYKHSNDVSETQQITGGGTVIQRGTGALTLHNTTAFAARTAFTGGTEIESGTLYVADPWSYNQADHRADSYPERAGTKAGYITFTGADGNGAKNVILNAADSGPGYVFLTNSFRTQTGAGTDNNLDLIPPSGPLTYIYGVNIEDKGGAFYVASGTMMNVTANELFLGNNIANGRLNDLYVEAGGTFNLGTGYFSIFDSGIDGNGTLNLFSTGSAALVQLSSSSALKTFQMGTTNVTGTGANALFLNLARNNPSPAGGDVRIVFNNTDSFNISGDNSFQSTMLAGDGIVQAGNAINVTGGVILTPLNLATFGESGALPGTLTLQSSTVNLSDFALVSQTGYFPGSVQTSLDFDSQEIPISNNDLLNIVAETVNLGNGMVGLRTATGTAFTPGDYLIIRSTNGFSGITTDAQLNALLSANVDGFDLNPVSNSPRGGYEFKLGGDPDASGNMTSGMENVWFTHDLNSLTMAWTGNGSEAVPGDSSWGSGELFYSLQDNNGNGIHERQFMTGDKVHVSGTNSFEIDLPASSTAISGKIVVSGLVVGRNTAGTDTNGVNFTISGGGGVTADVTSAFGEYVGTSLDPTGMLQKFGDNTLTFMNTGGNVFTNGIEFYGGTTAFNRADQLAVGNGKAVTFVGNATLQPKASLNFTTPVVINNGVTGTFDVGEDGSNNALGLFLSGNVNGPGNLVKTGVGVLQFANDVGATNVFADTTVTAGKFRITDQQTYNSSGTFTLNQGAELSGGGIVVAGNFDIGGKIASDTFTMDPDHMVVTGNARIATLTLQGSDSGSKTVVFNSTVVDTEQQGFNFDYRVITPNTSNDPTATPNDLLKIENMNAVELQGGVINVMTDGAGLSKGDYLVIDSNTSIVNTSGSPLDGINNPTGAVWGKINGNDIVSGGPRGLFGFELSDGETTNSQLWLTVDHNSLETVWQGSDGIWSTGTLASDATRSAWRSEQYTEILGSEIRDYNFYDGDLVYFNDTNATNYTVTADRNMIVSGVEVDMNVDTSNVTFVGEGGITARKRINPATDDDPVIIGVYADRSILQAFDTTGKLVKKGEGTLTLANTGTNFIEQGSDIHAGTIAIAGTEADRLGKYLSTTADSDGLVTFKNDNSGAADTTLKKVDVETAQTVQNRFVVEENVRNAAMEANADTIISDVVGDTQSGAFYAGQNSILQITANGGDITMTGNKTSGGNGNDIYLGNTQATFNTVRNHIFIDSGIAGTGTVNKSSGGILQIAADSDFQGTTTIAQGIFRVVGDRNALGSEIIYGNTVSSFFTTPGDQSFAPVIAGGGIIAGKTFTIGNDTNLNKVFISPDSARLSSINADVPDTQKFGTLTMQGNGTDSTLRFNSVVDTTPNANDRTGFHFDYDIIAPNSTAIDRVDVTDAEKNPTATPNDLLAVRGMSSFTLEGGVINFRTGADDIQTGRYLIIDSDQTITDENGDRFADNGGTGKTLDGINNYSANSGVLWGKLNGADMRPDNPRAERMFYLDHRSSMPVDSQIWLEVNRNTLKIDWQGGNGVWTTGGLWKSEQYSEIDGVYFYDDRFNNGDYIVFGDANGGYDVTLQDNATVSGMDADVQSAGSVVVIDGVGGIRAIRDNTGTEAYIEGQYAIVDDIPDPDQQQFKTSGKLVKKGAGELVFRNIGGNDFTEGIELYGGALSFDNATQLSDGGKGIAVKGNATLRPYADVQLSNNIIVGGSATATFYVGTDNVLILSGDVSGGDVAKTNDGVLQFSGDGNVDVGNTSVDGGEFRVVGKDYRTNDFLLTNFGTILAGNGRIVAMNTIDIVNGAILSPDDAVFTKTETSVDDREKYGLLTLQSGGGTTLNGFTFRYDVNKADETGDIDPAKDYVNPDVPRDQLNDLLTITGGPVSLLDGTVDFQGMLTSGKYLIVSSSETIDTNGNPLDGINSANGVLKSQHDGVVIESGLPRGSYEFVFATPNGAAPDSQIWLETEINSLTMDRSTGGNWDDATAWSSEQTSEDGLNKHETKYRDGDFAVLSTGTASPSLNVSRNVITSGLNVNGNSGDMTLTGSGGILATTIDGTPEGILIEGRYLDPTVSQGPVLVPTGKFIKTGNGTFTFANTGGNTFREGIDLEGGVVRFDRADQLGDGGNGIDFIQNTTLNPYANVQLSNTIYVGVATTATFDIAAPNAFILTGDVGGGNVTKTGNGVLQFSGVGTGNVGNTSIDGGEFRVVGKTYNSNGFTATSSTLSGNGTVSAHTILLDGSSVLSPDGAVFTETKTYVDDDEKFDVLTLQSEAGTTLNGFTFLYDVNKADETGDIDPAKDYVNPGVPRDQLNDLLTITGGPVSLLDGTVDFQGSLTSGKYLIVSSSETIGTGGNPLDGISDPDGVLKAKRNGISLQSGLPRATYEFKFETPSGAAVDSQIWLETEINSLTMDRSTGGTWHDAGWLSEQVHDGHRETTYNDGDLVRLTVVVGSESLGMDRNVTTSGLIVNGDGNMTLTGASITADNNSAFGEYLPSPDGFRTPTLYPTGKLQKSGSGTLTFSNAANTFMEGIELSGGATEFMRANQLGDGGNGIDFSGDAILRAIDNATIDNGINIADSVIGSLAADGDTTLTYTGMATGSNLSTLDKSGTGTVRLVTATTVVSDFKGKITASAGMLDVVGNYGRTTQFNVKSGATLSGTGTLGAVSDGGIVESGGTLKPGGLTRFTDTATSPVENPLTINGDLTFAAGSNFDVRITQFDDGVTRTPFSDQVKVVGGTVNIDTAANLNVEIDYWGDTQSIDDFNSAKSGHFTIIDASGGTVGNTLAQFILHHPDLPRGVLMKQGWNGNNDDLFQLWFDFDPSKGFGAICTKRNRSEIGLALDWFIENKAPGIQSLIDRLSDSSWTDAEVCAQLDQINGDLTSNALFMALTEPWRHPFNRLNRDSASDHCSPCGPLRKTDRFKRQLWGEFTALYENIGYDGNAHGFTINRYGIAIGVDQRLTRRSAVGATFQYADPRLRQKTGKVEMDDYEFGLYGMTRLVENLDVKTYLGYSHQRYDFNRYVSLPASPSGKYGAFYERLDGTTSGDTLAASVELIRLIQWRCGVRFLPVAALDFEQAWIRGYRESDGLTSLVYDDATLERLMVRFGLGGEFDLTNGFSLISRIQYATQLNGTEYPSVGVRFAGGALPDHRTADIWGSRIGRDYVNVGFGANWKLNDLGDKLLYVNYDTKWYRRATIHAGEAGFVTKW